MSSIPFKKCPVKVVLAYIGKKWSIEIIWDLIFGNRRFKDFLRENPQLSSKVLAHRLKELEQQKITTRSTKGNHLSVEYFLTEQGFRLKRVLYELSLFSYDTYLEELFENETPLKEEFTALSNSIFQIE